MQTATRDTKAGPIERNIHVEMWSHEIRATITEYRRLKTKETSTTTTYLLRRIPSQLGGTGVEIEKLDGSGEVYHALLYGTYGHTCDCPHGTYRANTRVYCRHVAAALEALERGIL